MHLGNYLGLLGRGLEDLADAYRQVARAHQEEPDILANCRTFAADCDAQREAIRPFTERYGEQASDEPDRMEAELFQGARSGGLGLLRDLHDVYLIGHYVDITWTMVGQAGKGLRDRDLIGVVEQLEGHTAAQLRWLKTRMKQAAPQALVVG